MIKVADKVLVHVPYPSNEVRLHNMLAQSFGSNQVSIIKTPPNGVIASRHVTVVHLYQHPVAWLRDLRKWVTDNSIKQTEFPMLNPLVDLVWSTGHIGQFVEVAARERLVSTYYHNMIRSQRVVIGKAENWINVLRSVMLDHGVMGYYMDPWYSDNWLKKYEHQSVLALDLSLKMRADDPLAFSLAGH